MDCNNFFISCCGFPFHKLYHKEIKWEGGNWIDMTQDMGQWWAFVHIVMNLLVVCEISSSHGGEYDVQSWPLKRRSTNILHGSITQKTTLNNLLVP
jgi:hypothetical protein